MGCGAFVRHFWIESSVRHYIAELGGISEDTGEWWIPSTGHGYPVGPAHTQ